MMVYEAGEAEACAQGVVGPHQEPWLNVLDTYEPSSPAAIDLVLQHPEIRPLVFGHVIDLGAGTCWATARFSTVHAIERVVALDMSERFLTEVGSRVLHQVGGDESKVAFAVGSYNDVPLPSASFNTAFLIAAIHHSLSPIKTLLEARRLLRPDGTLVLVEQPAPLLGVNGVRRRFIGLSRSTSTTELCYTFGELRYLLQHAGFDSLKFYPVDALTRGRGRRVLRKGLRALGIEALVRPPTYVIVARRNV